MLIYIETSAINWLFNNLQIQDALPTRNYQLYKDRKWITSSVTLWEIFNTSDKDKRSSLLNFSRQLLYGKLIKSPEEIIVTYILKNCPILETWSTLESNGLFSREWEIATSDLDYYFNISGEGFTRRTEMMRYYRKLIYSFLDNETYVLEFGQKIHQLDFMINQTLKYLEQKNDQNNIRTASVKVAIIYTLMILCSALSLDFEYIENFWKKQGINRIDKRMKFIIEKYPDIFFRGPIANLARMTAAQHKASSRGMTFDAMHAIYLTYIDLFITADEHFLKLSNVIKDPNYNKVIHVKDMTLFHV